MPVDPRSNELYVFASNKLGKPAFSFTTYFNLKRLTIRTDRTSLCFSTALLPTDETVYKGFGFCAKKKKSNREVTSIGLEQPANRHLKFLGCLDVSVRFSRTARRCKRAYLKDFLFKCQWQAYTADYVVLMTS